jgi:hypothetical protein
MPSKIKLAIFFVLLTLPLLNSCYKEPDPGLGRVIVIDANKTRVPNATVKLSQGQIKETFVSDYKGEVEYTSELEVILNVDVKRNAATGSGILRVKPGEVNTTVVQIL